MKPNNYATLTIWRLTDSLWRSDSLYLEADDVVKRICGEGTGGLLVISARHRHPLKRQAPPSAKAPNLFGKIENMINYECKYSKNTW